MESLFLWFPYSAGLLSLVQWMIWTLETPKVSHISGMSCAGEALEQGEVMEICRSPGERQRKKTSQENWKWGQRSGCQIIAYFTPKGNSPFPRGMLMAAPRAPTPPSQGTLWWGALAERYQPLVHPRLFTSSWGKLPILCLPRKHQTWL